MKACGGPVRAPAALTAFGDALVGAAASDTRLDDWRVPLPLSRSAMALDNRADRASDPWLVEADRRHGVLKCPFTTVPPAVTVELDLLRSES